MWGFDNLRHNLISSFIQHLDYHNSCFYHLRQSLISELQLAKKSQQKLFVDDCYDDTFLRDTGTSQLGKKDKRKEKYPQKPGRLSAIYECAK